MAIAEGIAGVGAAVKVALSAELVYQLGGANLSSPQSNELNAKARAPTLQKWVNINNLETAGWVVFLAVLDKSWWWILGGGLALGGMYLKYRHAINSGLSQGGAPTEDYGRAGW